ncbi:MAG TPA: nucleotidyltransferase family protein [Terriglobia bacterium]|nr:nucleotidyltransferase family protein [Terriglobia bacterium]
MSLPPESHPDASSPEAIAAIVLAAGESSRMGTDKALLMYRGRTFLENIISSLHDAGVRRVVIVLGHHAGLIQQRIDLSTVEFVVNQDYGRGQTSSLQAGLRALTGNEPNGVIVCLVDHPAFSVETARKLIQHFSFTGRSVVIPQIDGIHGHPVLLGRELFGKLLALGPHQGADTVVHQYRGRTEFVDVADPGILIDVDDPESYRNLTTQE